ncbi:MAG: hypothetical protein IJR00_11535 [Lachnospiraceae bacterium]|nr:hypothetical protein [Lachnospiraceae bacterium]
MKYLPQEKVERVKKGGAETNQSPQAEAAAESKAPASADSGKALSQEEALHFMREELYGAIPEFAAVYDQDGILGLLRQTEAYRIPDADRKTLEQIRKCVSSSDWNGLSTIIGEKMGGKQ